MIDLKRLVVDKVRGYSILDCEKVRMERDQKVETWPVHELFIELTAGENYPRVVYLCGNPLEQWRDLAYLTKRLKAWGCKVRMFSHAVLHSKFDIDIEFPKDAEGRDLVMYKNFAEQDRYHYFLGDLEYYWGGVERDGYSRKYFCHADDHSVHVFECAKRKPNGPVLPGD